jgi:cellulose synthase/poly-beta-1,6-N-acetylglucosamine synthase-like glycosyltransferase
MKTILFFVVVAITSIFLARAMMRPPARRYRSIDALIPAYNEEMCIEGSVMQLLKNPYFNRIIVVNDGSSDRTEEILDRLSRENPRVLAIHQKNTGKGGALMNGVHHSDAEFVFLTDADTWVPAQSDGLGYMLAEMDRGADAVGGIPSSNLQNAGVLPHIRATVKLPMIILKRTFQQLVGGAPFIISGACGLFRRSLLLRVPFSDRTKVEDLDLTWTLVSRGYKVRQCNRSFVYSQECNSLKAEWLRWRRWIIGYAVCMRLHSNLLLTRYGILSILPMFLVVLVGTTIYGAHLFLALTANASPQALAIFLPLLWVVVAMMIAVISAWHHRRWRLVLLAPAAVSYVLLAYAIWLIHGLSGLLTGREPERDKPVRYLHVVE